MALLKFYLKIMNQLSNLVNKIISNSYNSQNRWKKANNTGYTVYVDTCYQQTVLTLLSLSSSDLSHSKSLYLLLTVLEVCLNTGMLVYKNRRTELLKLSLVKSSI